MGMKTKERQMEYILENLTKNNLKDLNKNIHKI